MIGRIRGGGTPYLSLGQARQGLRAGNVDLLARADKETVETYQREREAVDALARSIKDMKRQRKADAADKVARLKRELQQLRMFGGDPKAIARQAARIARELSSAVKEYASAGGGGAIVGGPPGGASQPAVEPGAQAATEDAAAKTSPDAVATTSEAATSEVAEREVTPPTAEERAETERQAFNEDLQQRIGVLKQGDAEREADRKFAREVREVAAAIKAVMAQARRAAKADRDPEWDELIKSAKGALAEVERMLTSGLGTDVAATSAPVNLLV